MNIINQENKSFGSMDGVKVRRDELLKTLMENKAAHDELYRVSESGYWVQLNNKLSEKRNEFETAVGDLRASFEFGFTQTSGKIESKQRVNEILDFRPVLKYQNVFGLPFPEDHSKDYNRAIKMVEMSVDSEFYLPIREFEQYVLNSWEWKTNFLQTSNFYNTTVFSGCLPTATSALARF